VLADRFYRQMLFHRCLTAWLLWLDKAKEERMLKEQHDKRAEKMATLLKAASSGQLWQDKITEEESGSERNSHVVEDLVRFCRYCNSLLKIYQDTFPESKKMYFLFMQEQIFEKPFKLDDLPQDSSNPSVLPRTTKKKENQQRQAWPHQKLHEMKNRKPKKKQNALLENIGSLTTRTQSSTTSMQCKNAPYIEDSTLSEAFLTPKENKPLTNKKSINLHSQDLESNTVETNENSKPVQRVVDTCMDITQAKNVTKDSTTRHNVAVEGSEPPQSIRSTSSTASKSKVMPRKPPTKTLHLGMCMACLHQ
jgi:hypothetical protein